LNDPDVGSPTCVAPSENNKHKTIATIAPFNGSTESSASKFAPVAIQPAA